MKQINMGQWKVELYWFSDTIIDLESWEFLSEYHIPRVDYSILDYLRVLYMYVPLDEFLPVYIGKADKHTVRERHWSHKNKEKVYEKIYSWMQYNYPNEACILLKVADVQLLQDMKNYRPKLLHDIESLLIFKEAQYGGCPANDANTQTRNRYRPCMVAINNGDHAPLKKKYYDEPS